MNSQTTLGDYLVTAHTNMKQNGVITTQRYEICPCKKCFLNGYTAMGLDTKSLTKEQLSFTQNRVCVKSKLVKLHCDKTQITIDSLRATTMKLPGRIIVLKVGDPYVVNSPFTEFEKSVPVIPESLVQSGLYDFSIERVVVDQESSNYIQEEIVYEFAFLQFNKDDMIGYAYKILFGFGVKKSYPVKVGVSFLCTIDEGNIFQVVFTGNRGHIKFIREQAIPDMFEIIKGDTWKQSIAVPFPSDYELEFQQSESGIHVFPQGKGNLNLPITTRRLIILEMVRREALTKEEEKTFMNLYYGEVRIRDEGFLEFYPYEEELTNEIFEKTKSLPRITHSTSYPLPKYNTM
jgi:hypothetical protein